jgi:hypothetical protein
VWAEIGGVWGNPRPGAGDLGLGGGKWGCARRCICCSVCSEANKAKRVHAASEFVVLNLQGQRVCTQESVGANGGQQVRTTVSVGVCAE